MCSNKCILCAQVNADCLAEWGPLVKLTASSFVSSFAWWLIGEVGAFLAGRLGVIELGVQAVLTHFSTFFYCVPNGLGVLPNRHSLRISLSMDQKSIQVFTNDGILSPLLGSQTVQAAYCSLIIILHCYKLYHVSLDLV